MRKGATVELIRGRKNAIEVRAWSKWLQAVADYTQKYCHCVEDDDPFGYNETACVSLLVAGAALAGYVGLAEYGCSKRGADRRTKVKGRADFWMFAEGRTWGFEFKALLPESAPRERLSSWMQKARHDATKILKAEAEFAVAGLIVPSRHLAKEDARSRFNDNCSSFASEVDFCFQMTSEEYEFSNFFYFDVVADLRG